MGRELARAVNGAGIPAMLDGEVLAAALREVDGLKGDVRQAEQAYEAAQQTIRERDERIAWLTLDNIAANGRAKVAAESEARLRKALEACLGVMGETALPDDYPQPVERGTRQAVDGNLPERRCSPRRRRGRRVMGRKLSDREIVRSALHYAIQDREGMIDADPSNTKAHNQLAAFKHLLRKKYKELPWSEQYLGEPVNIEDIPLTEGTKP